MLLSRFWYVLTGLLLGLATFVLFLATSMYNRAGAHSIGERLSSDSQLVAFYLRDDARQRAGRLIQFGVDSDIAKYLQKSSESENKVPEEAREKLLGLLKKVHATIPKEEQFDAVFAVDQLGRVVAQLGYEQASGMADFELGGYPVVADALRGYVRDDTLVLERTYRVVARPVENDVGQLPAGAIVGARVVDDRFARELSSRTGAAVAFFANGQRTSAGAPEGFDASQLDQIVGDMSGLDQDDEYRDKGRSKVRVIGKMLGVQYSRLPGEAWLLGAGYAVARLPLSVEGPLDFFKKADDKDKEQAHVSLAAGLALGAALLGILFSVLEHTRPLLRFRSEARRLAKGEIDQLQPSRFWGVFRKLASDLNEGIDQVVAKGGGPRRGPADLKQVLGDIPDQPQMSAFSFPGDAAAASSSVPLSVAMPLSVPQKLVPSPPSGGGPRLPRPPPRPGAAPVLAAESSGFEPVGDETTGSGRGLDGDSVVTSAGSSADDDLSWRAVFDNFVSLKLQCGEVIEGFTYEKFEQTLKKSEQALLSQHGAKRVKFSVYVKNGKAALKASPLKD